MSGLIVYCPRCATPVTSREVGGRERAVCGACSYIHFERHNIGIGGVVKRRGKILLIRRAHDPGKGRWTIPGGYVEADEVFTTTIAREVKEEAGIDTVPDGVVGLRHRVDGGGSDLYLVCLLRPVDPNQQPEPDGVEVDRAGFYSLSEMVDLPNLAQFTHAIARVALGRRRAFGLVEVPGMSGPAWEFFAPPPRTP
ncbi:MAG: NUDIX hydrolase [Chloroflexi bacterium]|nr:NUDIX hydrolase [Chloroflexota bacterium]